jgi:pyrimidine-nucleoside phosphorylase
MVINQGGDVSVIDDTARLPKARVILPVTAGKDGFVSSVHTEKIGRAAATAGAGRLEKDDKIDHAAGIVVVKKAGDAVRSGDTLCFIHADDEEKARAVLPLAGSAYVITEQAPESLPPAVYAVIDEEGVHPCI